MTNRPFLCTRTHSPRSLPSLQARCVQPGAEPRTPRTPFRAGTLPVPPGKADRGTFLGTFLVGDPKPLARSWLGLGAAWANSPHRPGENPPRISGRRMGRGPGKSEAEGGRAGEVGRDLAPLLKYREITNAAVPSVSLPPRAPQLSAPWALQGPGPPRERSPAAPGGWFGFLGLLLSPASLGQGGIWL